MCMSGRWNDLLFKCDISTPFFKVVGIKKWSQLSDSNRRPAVYKTAALPLS